MTYRTYFKKNNYYNVKKHTNALGTFDSKYEAGVAEELDLLKKAKEIADYECQVKIDLRAYDKHICNYIIDFVVYHNDGTKEYIEAKGYKTEVWRLKWKLFEAQMNTLEPDSLLTIYEQKRNKRYGQPRVSRS